MKEKIHTIPVNEAFDSGDECPFCYLERTVEQRAIRYILGPGASYMEPDVRAATDDAGFCRGHYQKMYDYGNALGNALMMQTYYTKMMDELSRQLDDFEMPDKRSLLPLRKQKETKLPLVEWLQEKQDTCYICNRIDENQKRYFETFFVLIKEHEFREKVEKSKGFCMHHFGQLLDYAQDNLPNSQREWFYETVVDREISSSHSSYSSDSSSSGSSPRIISSRRCSSTKRSFSSSLVLSSRSKSSSLSPILMTIFNPATTVL